MRGRRWLCRFRRGSNRNGLRGRNDADQCDQGISRRSKQSESTPAHRAWQIIGSILFWLMRKSTEPLANIRIEQLWEGLAGDVALAAADALYRVSEPLALFLSKREKHFDLVAVPDRSKVITRI